MLTRAVELVAALQVPTEEAAAVLQAVVHDWRN